jgi:hypothetical protein
MSTGSIKHNIEITDSADAERFVEALEKAKAESEEGMEISELLEIAKKGNLTDCGQRKCANIIEALQQEIEKLKATLADWKYNAKCDADHIAALTADKDEQAGRLMRYDTVLKRAREALKNVDVVRCPYCWGKDTHSDKCEINKTITEIDMVIGENEDV